MMNQTEKLLEGLNPSQREAVLTTEGRVLVLAGAGSGKALTNDSIVKTPNGDTFISNLVIGSEVFNSDGEVSKVTGVYPQGEKEIWEVEFSDGAVVECCEDHLWSYQTAKQRTSGKGFQVASTKDLSTMPLQGKSGDYKRWNLYIPMTKAVSYPSKEYYISPYLLGALLGDGGFTRVTTSFSNSEDSVVTKVVKELDAIGYRLRHNQATDYSIVMNFSKKVSPLTTELKRLGLMGAYSNEKFIPSEYLTGSIEQRLDLLKGLIDTDGECTGSRYEYSTVSEQLALDVQELVQSLGMTCLKTERQTFYTYKGEKKPGQKSYRLTIKTSKEIPVIHSSHKHSQKCRKGQSYARRTIRRIEKTDRVAEMTCISVDAEDRLFLTNNFVLTHNTRVLTHRIAHLIQEGVNPWQILAITFTNKASSEMKERLSSITSDSRQAWIGTFHSICLRILSTNIHMLGIDKFTLMDSADQTSAIKTASANLGFDVDKKIIQSNLSQVSTWKNEGITPGEAMSISNGDRNLNEVAQVYQLYEDLKTNHNYFDFDDLILKTISLFHSSPELLGKYQRLFRYVLIDEFQDTNKIQFDLIEMLSSHHKNIFLVGDADQSIYSFRSAKIENILKYTDIHPETHMIQLGENYRSTQKIVEASNALVRHNKERLERRAVSVGEEGDNVHVIQFNDASREADFIARLISNLQRDEGRDWSDFAILYRMNFQSRHIELALRDENIPYRIVGSTSFYDRKEVKDIVSYIRACHNLNDDYAIQRIINVPKRSIGKTTIDKISDFATERKITFFKALENIQEVKEEKKINNPTTKRIEEFTILLKSLSEEAQNMEPFSADKFLTHLLKKTDFMHQFDIEKEEDLARIENVTYFREYAAGWDKAEKEENTIAQFLSEISLDVDSDDEDEDNYVTLTSVHSAKGLEWNQVFVIGMEDDTFPHFRAKGSPKELEEERRLAYVAMTRAAERLFLSYSSYKFEYNSQRPIRQKPSPFLSEIPEEFKISIVQTA